MRICGEIHNQIADLVVHQASPNYNYRANGEWFAVDTDGDGVFDTVMHRGGERNPWHRYEIAIAIDAIFSGSSIDFDPTPSESDFKGVEEGSEEWYQVWTRVEKEMIDIALSEIPEFVKGGAA